MTQIADGRIDRVNDLQETNPKDLVILDTPYIITCGNESSNGLDLARI